MEEAFQKAQKALCKKAGVIRDYKLGATPEEMVIHYPTLTLEQVYATITYKQEKGARSALNSPLPAGFHRSG